MNSVSILERKIGGYLKQYPEHNNMNFELVYTYLRYEEHKMASLIGKYMHLGKEITDYNCEMHRNICSNKHAFNSAIFLVIDHKIHNTKIS